MHLFAYQKCETKQQSLHSPQSLDGSLRAGVTPWLLPAQCFTWVGAVELNLVRAV